MGTTASIGIHNHGGDAPRVHAAAFETYRREGTRLSWHLVIDNNSICCHGYPVSLLDECIEALQSIRDEAAELEANNG